MLSTMTGGFVAAYLVVTQAEVVQDQRVMGVIHHQLLELLPCTVQIAFLHCGKSPFKLRLPADVLISVCAHDVSIGTQGR